VVRPTISSVIAESFCARQAHFFISTFRQQCSALKDGGTFSPVFLAHLPSTLSTVCLCVHSRTSFFFFTLRHPEESLKSGGCRVLLQKIFPRATGSGRLQWHQGGTSSPRGYFWSPPCFW